MDANRYHLQKCPRPHCNGDLQIIWQAKEWYAECLLCNRSFSIDSRMRRFLHQTRRECEIDGIPTTNSPMEVHYHRINQRYY